MGSLNEEIFECSHSNYLQQLTVNFDVLYEIFQRESRYSLAENIQFLILLGNKSEEVLFTA